MRTKKTLAEQLCEAQEQNIEEIMNDFVAKLMIAARNNEEMGCGGLSSGDILNFWFNYTHEMAL